MEGLYKVEYDINDGSGRSVLYAHAGEMLGGNTAFAHFGSYQDVGGEIVARLRTRRHSASPHHRSLVSSDQVTISIRGKAAGPTSIASRVTWWKTPARCFARS